MVTTGHEASTIGSELLMTYGLATEPSAPTRKGKRAHTHHTDKTVERGRGKGEGGRREQPMRRAPMLKKNTNTCETLTKHQML